MPVKVVNLCVLKCVGESQFCYNLITCQLFQFLAGINQILHDVSQLLNFSQIDLDTGYREIEAQSFKEAQTYYGGQKIEEAAHGDKGRKYQSEPLADGNNSKNNSLRYLYIISISTQIPLHSPLSPRQHRQDRSRDASLCPYKHDLLTLLWLMACHYKDFLC